MRGSAINIYMVQNSVSYYYCISKELIIFFILEHHYMGKAGKLWTEKVICRPFLRGKTARPITTGLKGF